MAGPVPVKDELDRALTSMRAGFLSGSSQIAAGVASLEEYLAAAPANERDRVGAAVGQIVSTQERLIVQIERLPAPPWDRFKRMVGILKAQQAILDDLSALVKEHVLPRQLEGLSAAAANATKPPPPAQRPAPPPRRRVVDDDPEPPDRERVGSGFKGLAAMIVAAVILSLIPRETKLQDVAAKVVALIGGGSQSTPADVSSSGTGAEPPAARDQRVPSDTVVADAPAAAAPAPRDDKRPAAARVPDAAAAADRPRPTAMAKPEAKRTATPAVEAAKPAPSALPEQFVPVLFTHQDQATVLQTLTELQEKYPRLLLDRKGEAQPVDMGKKGVWHRLVVLPAGARPEATKLCDQLMAEGYDRCWVKAY